MSDNVNNPSHYAKSCSIECFDAMHFALGSEGMIDFCVGNAFKYLWRHKYKNNASEDLDKARWYLDRGVQLSQKTRNEHDQCYRWDQLISLTTLLRSCRGRIAMHNEGDNVVISNEKTNEKDDTGSFELVADDDKPPKLKEKTRKERNFIPGITQEQIDWLTENADRPAHVLFKETKWYRLRNIINNDYEVSTVWDVATCRIPSTKVLEEKYHVSQSDIYNYRKELFDHGLCCDISTSPKTRRSPKVKPLLITDQIFSYGGKLNPTEEFLNTPIGDADIFKQKITSFKYLFLAPLKKAGIVTYKDVIMKRPSQNDLLGLEQFGAGKLKLFCNLMYNAGIMVKIDGLFYYCITHANDGYFRIIPSTGKES